MSLFHLVEFVDDDKREVAIIPGCWVLPGDSCHCYWPNHGDSSWVQRAVEPEDWWPQYEIKILQSGYDIERLKRLEKKALDFSDPSLTSDDNATERGQTKRKRNTKEIWSPVQRRRQSSPRVSNNYGNDTSLSSDTDEEDLVAKPQATEGWQNSKSVPSSQTGLEATARQSFILPLPPSPSTSAGRMTVRNILPPPPPPPSPRQSLSTGSRNQDVTHFERLFNVVEGLKAAVEANSRKMDLLLIALEKGNSSSGSEKAALPDGFIFPAASVEDLERLEALLSREEHVRQQMVRYLATIGGRDQKDCVRRIMATVVSNQLARQFNFFGLKGKRSFKELQFLTRSIYESARKLYPEITNAGLQEIISHWLTGSRDRDQGKKLRELSRSLSSRHGDETQTPQ